MDKDFGLIPLHFLLSTEFWALSNSLFYRPEKRSHTLRYTLKNRATGKVLLVILFTLYLKEDVDENGNVKDGVQGGIPFDKMEQQKAEEHRKLLTTDDDTVD